METNPKKLPKNTKKQKTKTENKRDENNKTSSKLKNSHKKAVKKPKNGKPTEQAVNARNQRLTKKELAKLETKYKNQIRRDIFASL